jgi:methylmalonyl-CoA/ethylmalonyl-CoA epimerase
LSLPIVEARGPSQIGILVHDLNEALEHYHRGWGGDWQGFRYGPATVPELTYRGERGRYAMTIAISGTTPQLELIQPERGPSIYHEFIDAKGLGIHHLGFWVDEITDAVRSMERAGYEMIQSGSGYGLDGDGGYAYFDTERELGIVIEAIEVPRRRREPDFVWPLRSKGPTS